MFRGIFSTYLAYHHLHPKDEVHNTIDVHRHHHVVLRGEAHLADKTLAIDSKDGSREM